MVISKNNKFLKMIVRNKFKNELLNKYNLKEGKFNEDNFNFDKLIIEKSNYYKNFYLKNNLNEISTKDFNAFNPKIFIKRFLLRFYIFFIAHPILLFKTTTLYFNELKNQSIYIKNNIKNINYDKIYKELYLTPFSFYRKIITTPLIYILNYFFGYIFERWAYSFLLLFFRNVIQPFIISIQITIIIICLALLPIILLFFIIKSLLKKFTEYSNNKKYSKIIDIFKSKILIK